MAIATLSGLFFGKRLRGALERFCAVFPDAFVVSDRGPYYNPKEAGKGRPLTAGFLRESTAVREINPRRGPRITSRKLPKIAGHSYQAATMYSVG